jgi:uncharacterized protein (DUF1778 family)
VHRPLTIRLTALEASCFQQAAPLLGTGLSQLVQAAVMEAALTLGFDSSCKETPPTPPLPWSDAPDREEHTSHRITVSLDALTARLLGRAAQHVSQSPPRFAVGATLRYLGNLRLTNSTNPHLKSLPLPPKYLIPRA